MLFACTFKPEYILHSTLISNNSEEDLLAEDDEKKKQHRKDIATLNIVRTRYCEQLLSEMISVYVFQICLCAALLLTLEMPEYEEPPAIDVIFTRFIAGMLLQIKMSNEL